MLLSPEAEVTAAERGSLLLQQQDSRLRIEQAPQSRFSSRVTQKRFSARAWASGTLEASCVASQDAASADCNRDAAHDAPSENSAADTTCTWPTPGDRKLQSGMRLALRPMRTRPRVWRPWLHPSVASQPGPHKERTERTVPIPCVFVHAVERSHVIGGPRTCPVLVKHLNKALNNMFQGVSGHL